MQLGGEPAELFPAELVAAQGLALLLHQRGQAVALDRAIGDRTLELGPLGRRLLERGFRGRRSEPERSCESVAQERQTATRRPSASSSPTSASSPASSPQTKQARS
jgi:hypothetical protein